MSANSEGVRKGYEMQPLQGCKDFSAPFPG
jgi:hypothetical protein